MTQPIFRATGISKRFGATLALSEVSFTLDAGRVRALVGENGAGKSTLMAVIAGAERADSGSMQLGGIAYAPRQPGDARRAGVAMIHQELSIAGDLTVVENVMLGVERARGGFTRRLEQRALASAALARLGRADIDLDRAAGKLGIAERQIVEIARALVADARVVVFDEPTSSLDRDGVESLFAVIRELCAQRIAVVYISHFLDEVARIADDWTVLRDGRVVGEGAIEGTTADRLVTLMAGREVARASERRARVLGEPLLEIRGLSGVNAPRDIDLFVARGEVFGIAGLVGAGRSELLRTVFGLDRTASGAVTLRGDATDAHGNAVLARNARDSIRARVGFVSEDRKDEGLMLSASLVDNVTLSRLEPHSSAGVLMQARRHDAARAALVRLRCKYSSPAQAVGELSGGNQQKVAIARLLHQDAELLLLDEPTRGIDVAAKAEIHALVLELSDAGKTILFASSDTSELLQVCDRIGVMHRGRLVEVRAASQWTSADMLRFATGAEAGRT
jgi:ribose transport system ATP-binding protein